MLQNRVDPSGHIIRTTARGNFMGNRGLLHDDKQEIRRNYRLIAWITCVLEFRGRKRAVMAPGMYTELFFLDEATSFAAGHRPCFECRRAAALSFKTYWLKGNPEYRFNLKTSIKEIDNVLHQERIGPGNEKLSYEENADRLPDGTFILFKNEAYLIKGGSMYLWSPEGYGKTIVLPLAGKLEVLTPKSIVNAFRAGYIPHMKSPESRKNGK